MRYPILDVCARIEGHTVQYDMLQKYCHGFEDWHGLLVQAEHEGMAPLLRKHLIESKIDIPGPIRRSLSMLYKRHQKKATVRLMILEEIVTLFSEHQLTPMLIKGAALCQSLYPDSALRPMRDIDILVSKGEVDQAQELLRDIGFTQSSSPIPPDHYHLPSLHKIVDGVKICIELHRGLYPNCPPDYPDVDFDKLLDTGQMIQVGDVEAVTFSHMETLHYLYQHAFRTPLTYESYKLINVADIIGYTEKYYETLDWPMIKDKWPLLFNALPLMQHITPWDDAKISSEITLSHNVARYVDTRPFTGWPHHRMKEQKVKGPKWYQVLRDTFLPPMWWAKVYYGEKSWQGYLKCILLRHPRHILWWKQLYFSLMK